MTTISVGETTELHIPAPAELETPPGSLWLPTPEELWTPDGLLRDPEGVDLGRAEPPMEKWPGRIRGKQDVINASGHPRDYFRYGHRQLAQIDFWMRLFQARERRSAKSYFDDFSWNQIMIFGEYGGGKTTIANMIGARFGQEGHAVFSNTSTLIGWHLEGVQMFTAIPLMPYCSVMIIDEGSAWLAARSSATVAVGAFIITSLNIRKKNIFLIIVSAQDRNVAPGVRDYCKEAWRPVEVVGDPNAPKKRELRDADDPDNFILAWDVWDDYPYRRNDLIDEDGKNRWEGFGDPAYTKQCSGEEVRNAFLITDSFDLADAGAAFLNDRDEVKSDLEEQRGDKSNDGYGNNEFLILSAVVGLMSQGYDDEYIDPGLIASKTKMDPGQVGRTMKTLFDGVKNRPRYGYSSDTVFEIMREKYLEQ